MKVLAILLLGIAATHAEKIVGGSDAGGPIPYQVRIQYSSGSIRCGGSLISAEWVVSAAHCKASGHKYQDWTLVLGYYDGTEDNSESRTVLEQIYNADYSSNTMDNDIMVLKLNAPVNMISNVIGVVALPEQDANNLQSGDDCVVSGWGDTTYGGDISAYLQKVTMDYMTNAACNIKNGNQVTPNMLCLSAPGKDSCQGDSGGPAVCGGILEGIVSWGYGCADPDYPGVYTRVSKYRNWINSQTGV